MARSIEKILVTGGAGFIGSNFCRLLLKEANPPDITIIDKLTYAGSTENMKDIIEKVNFIEEDIADSHAMMELFAKNDFQVIVNFAAESHVDRSLVDASPFLRSNIIGTAVLLEAAKKYRPELFCQISTDEVYGSIDEGSFTEESIFKPSSPYSASKASADNLANAYFTSFGVPVVITRSSNNYGPYQYPEKLIPHFIKLALSGKNLTLYGDGKNVRDWLYVDDNCRGIKTVIQKGKLGEVYNIGANAERTNTEIAALILDETGAANVSIDYIEDRLGHDRRYSLDSSKLKGLGWKPEVEFDEAFRSTINWFQRNPDFWKKEL